MTDAQQRAFNWLNERGGTGMLDRYGRVLAMGEISPSTPVTWLRLVGLGKLQIVGARLTIIERREK